MLDQALAALDRAGEHLGHPDVALERHHLRRLVGRRDDTREQLAGRGHDDGVGLAERRQHLVDVAQEDPVRPDDEHAGAGDPLAVGVDQERGPVQRDRRLAGARAALHHEHAGERRADHRVLVGLDRRDDVAHVAAARRVEAGEQRTLADDDV